MGEFLQGREGLLIFAGKKTFVRLDTVEVEGPNATLEGLICREVAGKLRRILQALPDGFRGFCHACFLHVPCAAPMA